MTTYLARYHSDSKNIHNYEFIFRMKNNTIDKVLFFSDACNLCNNDTIYNITHGNTLDGLNIVSISLQDADKPDIFTLSNNKSLLLYRVYTDSYTQYITKDVVKLLARHIIMNDPLLSEYVEENIRENIKE